MKRCLNSSIKFFLKNVTVLIRYTRFTNRKYNASARERNTRNMNLATKPPCIRSFSGIILAAVSFRNEYDGHTVEATLQQMERMIGRCIDNLACDRGYRGIKQVGTTKILIPESTKHNDGYYQKKKKHKLFCKRAVIEATIGCLKSDYRLSRNFYKGVKGDAINIMPAVAAYNFKRAMRVLLWFIKNHRKVKLG